MTSGANEIWAISSSDGDDALPDVLEEWSEDVVASDATAMAALYTEDAVHTQLAQRLVITLGDVAADQPELVVETVLHDQRPERSAEGEVRARHDRQSDHVDLLLARPVRRWRVVLAKFLAVATGVAVIAVVAVVVRCRWCACRAPCPRFSRRAR